jgi:hypothetical protein
MNNQENKSIVKRESAFVQKVFNQIAITNKLVATSERQNVIRLFIDYPIFFKNIISLNYPLTNFFINSYKDKLNWEQISLNENIKWSKDLIEKHEDKWYWKYLGQNRKIPLTYDLIYKYEQKWEWNWLSFNSSINWTEQMDYYLKKIDIEATTTYGFFFYASPVFPWSENIIRKYSNRWSWKNLSGCAHLP